MIKKARIVFIASLVLGCLASAPCRVLALQPTEAFSADLKLADDIENIVFAVRPFGPDPHYYANFGYYSHNPDEKVYPIGGQLCRWNIKTARVQVLLDDPQGGVRDPQLHYDGQRILFSYRPGASEHYHLFEIDIDGTNLRQLTDGPHDDIEPTYLPDGSIAFCSSRCNRWVACWKVPVANLHHCDGDGQNIRMISSNAVTENTPAVLPDGRLLYTRWEYNDRSQLAYHHLWTVHRDGTGQMTYFGNMHPTGEPSNIAQRVGNRVKYNNVGGAEAMLDAKPIPGTRDVIAIFSPGHGRREHEGFVTVVDPGHGPDDRGFARRLHASGSFRDPYPINTTQFLVARGRELLLMDDLGQTKSLFTLTHANAEMRLHEPTPLRSRPREQHQVTKTDRNQPKGQFVVADVRRGRNMDGVRLGEIRQLLVLEQLPVPFHNSPGFDGISLWGPFTLSRILGTVPVEADGSANFEAPAMRSLFFVALDEAGLAVKKMQSFVTLQPGETTSCVGCHESRTESPRNPGQNTLLALQRSPSQILPIAGQPQIIDFRRHIQPILDRHCTGCHDVKDPDGGICLAGTRGVPSHGLGRVLTSYVELVECFEEVVDGRNAHGNRPPRRIGSAASKLMSRIDGSHYDVCVSAEEATTVRLWLDSGAVANGTYAIMDGGSIEEPSWQYVREMKRYGILPASYDPSVGPIDVYETDEAYFRSFWYQPPGG